MPKGIGAGILAALDSVQVGGLIYLVKVTVRSGVKYWGERGGTFLGNVYEARLQNASQLSYAVSDSEELLLTFANVDGAITTLDRAESFVGAKVEIIEYLDGIADGYVKWTGWADEFREITPLIAVLPVFSGSPTTRVEVPRRTIELQCPWEFAIYPDRPAASQTWVDGTDFEGSECPYQRVSTIGFTTTTNASIDATTDPVTFAIIALPDSQVLKISDLIKIDSEVMLVTGVSGLNTTCARAQKSTTKASHLSGATLKFYNCQFSVDACKRRGMFGNNTSDQYSSGGTKNRNYFGGFPLITGQIHGKFRQSTGEKARRLTVAFSGNESGYGAPLASYYGNVRVVEPRLIVARAEGDFLLTLWAVSEGVLATNATNGDQAVTYNAYAQDGGSPPELIYVNGQRRHDPRAGFGIQVFNGQMDQPPPGFGATPSIIPEFDTNHLGFWGTAWVMLRTNIKNSPSVDIKNLSISADFEIQYGKVVRVYTDAVTYTRKASTSPAMVLLDQETSKRSGGGVDHARFDLASFVTVAAYNVATVTNTVDGSSVPRWTFNGGVDNKRPFEEYEAQICLGMYCLPPFEGIDGKLKIKSLKSESLVGLPLFSSKSGTSRNIIFESGISSLTKGRQSIRKIPNEIRVNFVAKETDKWIKTQLIVSDRDAQRQVGTILGDASVRVVPKSLDLLGAISVDEAARIGSLVLRAGEFAQGGLSNNLAVKFKAFYKDASNVEKGDIVRIEDDQLHATTEQYFRVIEIREKSIEVKGGGFVFFKEIEATLHDNAIYDDTAYATTRATRIDPPNPYDYDAPQVTGFAIAEDGVVDSNGVPQARLTITYTAPATPENFKDVIIMRSTTSGCNSDCSSGCTTVGDWRFVAEISASPTTIFWDASNKCEVFVALSRNIAGGTPDPGTLKVDSTFKYPRVTVKVDGAADSGPPAGFSIITEAGPDPNSVIVRATKPTTNWRGGRRWVAQVKNSGTGSWRALDANAGAAVTKYDGSAIAHERVEIAGGTQRIKRTAGAGFGTAAIGDLVLVDARGGAFGVNYCQHGTITDLLDAAGNPVAVGSAVQFTANGFHPLVDTDLRIKIVKPHWDWNTEGYLGDLPGKGIWGAFISDDQKDEYISDPIKIEGDYASIDTRVWFENAHFTSDSSTLGGSTPTVSANAVSVKPIGDRIEGAGVFFSIIDGTFTNNSPSGGRVAWAGVRVLYNGITYSIADADTANKWIYWQLASPTVFSASATVPALVEDEFFVGLNETGTFVSSWKRVDVDGSHIRAATITGDRITANTITAGKLSVAQLSAISADVGTITAGTITGALLRSAAAGQRIEFDATSLRMINAAGTTKARLNGTSNSGIFECEKVMVVGGTEGTDSFMSYFTSSVRLDSNDGSFIVVQLAGNVIVEARAGRAVDMKVAGVTIGTFDANGLDCGTKFVKGALYPRKVIDANNPPAAPTMGNGELIVFLASHASVSRWFNVFFDGTNRFYFESGGTGGVNLF